ncbi:ATPase associated with various cellular activities, AAA_5 [hydrothermal vent metagenome]|uniref:ATPase associated with various cellular activities, AAA_5 n=1 Tax=hydrothermal vent metagenome TaxID=652676 RepID=A0A3B1EA88_9ZZZZ
MNTKNIILYGAPGVGKTHNYQRIISMIENNNDEKYIFDTITNNTSSEIIEQNSETFQNIKDENRVEFVTFHQSYSYEDFIEGFRPNEHGNIQLEDGIFKLISDKASKNIENSNKDIFTIKEDINLKEQFKQYIDYKLENNSSIKLKRGEEFYLDRFENDKLYFKTSSKSNTNKELNLSYSDFEAIHKSLAPKVTLADISNILNTNSIQQKYAYYSQINLDFQSNKTDILNRNIDITNEKKNFYIVIDEINRGNISKIFGELITLIEEDTRDSYEITLPYSKKPFKIPSNLYIIATMNSTDKSIATIDIALRRRFTFLKMLPNLELVDNREAKELMGKLNEYIKLNINEDYMLGHSYFMKVKNIQDLEFVKEYKIKPLLEEYFYADDAKLDEVVSILETSKP